MDNGMVHIFGRTKKMTNIERVKQHVLEVVGGGKILVDNYEALLRVARAANAYVSYVQLKHSREWDWEKAQLLYVEYDDALKEVEDIL